MHFFFKILFILLITSGKVESKCKLKIHSEIPWSGVAGW